MFTISNLLNAAIPFLLLPLLTNYLTKADFGIVSMFLVLSNILTPLIGFNADGVMSRFYFEKDKLNFNVLVSQSFILVFSCASVIVCPLIIFNHQIIVWAFGVDGEKIAMVWLLVILAIVVTQNIMQMQLALWQVEGKTVSYGILRVSKTCIEIGLSFLLIAIWHFNWYGRMEAQLAASVLFAGISIYFLTKQKYLLLTFTPSYFKQIIGFGLPLVPHILSGVVIAFADRWFITHYISLEEAGLYSVGYQVGMIISLFQNSFNQAWVPWLFDKLTNPSAGIKNQIVKFTYLYFIVMMVLVLLLTVCAPFIFKVFVGKAFYKAIVFVFWIALGFGFNGMYKMVVNYIFFIKKTYWITVSTLTTACINIALCYYMVPAFGAIGAAQATCIAFGVEFIFIWILSSQLYKMPWLSFYKK